MDNERYTLENKWRKKVLIIDDCVHLISLLGRGDCNLYKLPTFAIGPTERSGARRGQRSHNKQWNRGR